jgi:hypothetical protein
MRTFGSSFLDTKPTAPKLLHISRSRDPRRVQITAGISLRVGYVFRNLRTSHPASRPRSKSMSRAAGSGALPASARSRYIRASTTRSQISNSSNPARRADAATVRSSATVSSRTKSKGIKVIGFQCSATRHRSVCSFRGIDGFCAALERSRRDIPPSRDPDCRARVCQG